jgi:type II secretory pathway predicted ATPase ExeA
VYLDYFGLKEAPFRITPNTEYWYAGGQRGEILAALAYAIAQGEGLIKVVGEVGSGKTMLCRMLAAKLPPHIDPVYLGNPTLAPDDMLAAILADLGDNAPPDSRQARLAELNRILLARHAGGRRVVVFVEEAQGIAPDSLEFLRLLTNLETATDKLLQLVLFGQPELDVVLADPRIRQLKDRITLNLTLAPLNETEVGHYLRTRLAVAGYRGPDLFSDALAARIARLSGGLSRRINLLADKSLLAAYAAQTHTLGVQHLDAARHDSEPRPARAAATRRWLSLAAGLLAALGLAAFVAWQTLKVAAKPVAAAVPARAASTPAPIAPPNPLQLAAETQQWLQRAAPGTCVIQLAATQDAAAITALLGRLKAHSTLRPLRVMHGISRGEPAWMILGGEFADRRSALKVLPTLPDARDGAHFLRSVRKMRTLVLPPEPL